ncbi:hypothetical protein ABER61_03405 [Brevibacillus formosus]|uniref:Copper amine oxidase n=1 Tax=Brevibacillus formosus TaxID=54913 RepID=A0A837KF39_9BACL|nr:hypothetical protein [Brevibacillus formosus]KLH96410.1 hypothetical protein AA984_25235 [Brevibacillus formosus]MED1958443.1 hypothetical protein [Brevibacillus formosus]PSJ94464.1 hypothetical protein C7R91_17280 [Brevibacillus formosus]GED60120.1 hypothetical protein BFO01nite_42520 [Brevibacillus formosus]
MKPWHKTMAAVLCSGAVLMASGVGAEPVQASGTQSQAFAPVVLLQPEQNIPFTIQFVDGFVAKVTNTKTKATSTVDISENKATYVKQGIYHANGKLQKATDGYTQKLAELVPFRDAQGNLRYMGKQTLYGLNTEDRLAVATSVWNIVDKKPQLLQVTVQKADWDNVQSPDVRINSGFNMGSDSTFVLDTKYADVTGDNIKDHIFLIGDKMGVSMNQTAHNLRLVVREGKNNQQMFIPVGKRDSGILPKLTITDGNADQVKDILVTMPTATGHVYSQLTWKENRLQPVVEQEKLNDRQAYQPIIGVYGEAVGMNKAKKQ